MRNLYGLILALISVLALSGLASASPPEPKNFVAVLSGECPQADADWRGVAVFHLNTDGSVDYKVVSNNIDEPLIAGHIHFLPPGEPRGPVVQDLGTVAPAGHQGVVTEGTFTNADLVAGLLAGDEYYVNLHTETCFLPLGAVRGPLTAAPSG
jgi:hypothetical protein